MKIKKIARKITAVLTILFIIYPSLSPIILLAAESISEEQIQSTSTTEEDVLDELEEKLIEEEIPDVIEPIEEVSVDLEDLKEENLVPDSTDDIDIVDSAESIDELENNPVELTATESISEELMIPMEDMEIGEIGVDLKKETYSQFESNEVEIEKKLKDGVTEPLQHFLENDGQIDEAVRYYTAVESGTVFVTENGIVYDFITELPQKDKASKDEKINGKDKREQKTEEEQLIKKFAIQESFIEDGFFSRKKNISLKDMDEKNKTKVKVSYYLGSKEGEWKDDISTYETLELGEMWKNIDVKLESRDNNIEKIFTVNPGGKVKDIQIELDGAPGLSINGDTGELIIETGSQEKPQISFTKPIAFQEIDGNKSAVEVRYILDDKIYGFEVGEYNKEYPLFIDPLIGSTYLGGANSSDYYEYGADVTTDSLGNIYVTGSTHSVDFPVTVGSYDQVHGISDPVFVSKFNSDLSTLLASTFLGGNNNYQRGQRLEIDPSNNNVIVAGYTRATDFPVTGDAYDQTYNGGNSDLFVARFDSNLSSLLASTLLGSIDDENEADDPIDFVLDASGNIIIVGETWGANFPTTTGAYKETYTGEVNGSDVFVSKLSGDLSTLSASTLFGGYEWEWGSSIELDSLGNIVIAGDTYSEDLPTTPGAYNEDYNGLGDLFIAKFDQNLSTLQMATYFGSSKDDVEWCAGLKCYEVHPNIAIDSNDNIFIAGSITSEEDFPVTAGAYDTTDLNEQSYVAKFNSNLSALLASTFLSKITAVFTMDIDSNDNIFVAGMDYGDSYMGTQGAFLEQYPESGGESGFVMKLNNTLSELKAGTYLGGQDDCDSIYEIEIDSEDAIIATGYATSYDFPMTSTSYDRVMSGRQDGFVSKLSNQLSLNLSPSKLFPEDNSIGFSLNSNLVIEYELLAYEGVGKFKIKKVSDDSVVETIDASSFRVTGWGTDTITINPALNLESLTQYYVEMSDGFALDAYGHLSEGIASDTMWNFTTQAFATIIRDVGDRECYEVGSAELNQPSSSIVSYSNDNRVSWSYIPIANSNGLDCNVTNLKLQYDDALHTTGQDLEAEFVGIYSNTDAISEGNGKVVAELNQVNSSDTFTFGGNGYDSAKDIAIDNFGNIFTTGSFTGTADFDATAGVDSRSALGATDIFITRYNADGTYGWTKAFGSPTYSSGGYLIIGSDSANAIATDINGDIIVTGYYNGTVDFDPTAATDIRISGGTDTQGTSEDIFITKYRADGTYVWTRTFWDNGNMLDYGDDIATDASGNIFVTGLFTDTVDFDATAGTDYRTAPVWSRFLTKYNSDGSYGWTLTSSSGMASSGQGISIDAAGNIFVVGRFHDTQDLNDTAGINNFTSNGSSDVYITKYNSNGSYGWTRTFGGTSGEIVNNIFMDETGNLLITGYFEGAANFDGTGGTDIHTSNGVQDVFITKYNTNDGSYGWTRTFGGTDFDEGRDISVDDSGQVFVTGGFGTTVNFDATGGTDINTAIGIDDVFIAKYNADGSYGWTRTLGGSANGSSRGDIGNSILVDLDGDVVVTGEFYSIVDFDDTGYVDTYTSTAYSDVFISTYHEDGTYANPTSFYDMNGFYRTQINSQEILTQWDEFSATTETLANTTVYYEIMDQSCGNSLVPKTTTLPIDISSIDIANKSLCLEVTFETSDDQITPKLDSWMATYYTESANLDPQFDFTVVEEGEYSADIIEDVPDCECYEIGSAEATQPENTTLEFSNNDRESWNYIPVDDGSGKDCSVSNIKLTQENQINTVGEDLTNEFLGAFIDAEVIDEDNGKIVVESSINPNSINEIIVSNEFNGGGVAQGWRDDDAEWGYTLPFMFNFYGTNYTNIKVGSNGIICLDNTADCTWYPDPSISNDTTFNSSGIVPLGIDLVTDANPTSDIYITENSDSVVFRWEAAEYDNTSQINFEVVLYRDGRIKFNYGIFDSPLSEGAVVGITNGGETTYVESEYQDSTNFNLVGTALWQAESIYVSLGTYKAIIRSATQPIQWNDLVITQQTPANTTIKYKVLDETCSTTIIPQTSNTTIDLSDVSSSNSALCLEATLETTDSQFTPSFEKWIASYETDSTGVDLNLDYLTKKNPSCLSVDPIESGEDPGDAFPDPKEDDDDDSFIKIKESDDDSLTFEVVLDKGDKVKSDSVDSDDDKSTNVKNVALENKEDEKIEGEITIESKKGSAQMIYFESETCTPFQVVKVDSDFSDKNIEEFSLSFRIPEGWLKKYDFDNLMFVKGDKEEFIPSQRISTKNKWAILLSNLMNIGDSNYIYKVSADSIRGWWGIYGCSANEGVGEVINTGGVTEGEAVVSLFKVEKDIDSDGKMEEAINEDQDSQNGYETFNDPDRSSVLIIIADGDNDKKDDFFISTDGDNVPDIYWDSDDNSISQIELRDIDNDQTLEYLFDPNQTGKNNYYYDPDDKLIKEVKGIETAAALSWLEKIKNLVAYLKTIDKPIIIGSILLPLLAISSRAGSFNQIFLVLKEGYFRMLGILFWRKKKRYDWGVIYDTQTGKPIQLAAVSVIDIKTGRAKETVTTDKYGSYCFLVTPGNYSVKVVKKGFQTPEKSSIDKWNTFYQNSYFGEALNFTVPDKIAFNLPLEQINAESKSFLNKATINLILDVFFWLGMLIDILICFFYPQIFNFVMLAIYIYVAFLRDIALSNFKWGLVKDKGGTAQPFSVIKLMEQVSQSLITRTIADEQGRYFLVANRGNYFLQASTIGENSKTGNQRVSLVKRAAVKERVVV